MQTSTNGINLIKKFEGCRLTAYKPVSTEKYWTIGYGHYGADVTQGMTITQAQADAYLKSDLAKFEKAVNSYNLSWINQNRFDALVSFTYNCGAANLKTLLANGTRSAETVSTKLLAYNKAGGKVLKGLVTRRQAEKDLFDNGSTTSVNTSTTSSTVKSVQTNYKYNGVDYSRIFDPTFYSNNYHDLKSAFGTDATKLFQHFCTYGMKEGRQPCSTFNVQIYKERYIDLKNAFGTNLPKYYEHYCVFGYKENRKAI